MAQHPDSPDRGTFLKWLFYLSNTPHALLRQLFYAERYVTGDHADNLHAGLTPLIARCFETLETVAAENAPWLLGDELSVLDLYLCALLRWSALYPVTRDRTWFDLSRYPALRAIATRVEALPATAALQEAEGLGDTPFTAPTYPNPPEGSAT